MRPFFHAGGVSWYHQTSASQAYLDEIIETLDLHEIIAEDIMESTTQDKIDVYDQSLFIVLHFPKYNTRSKKYVVNEFNIIMTKTQIITLSNYHSNHIDKIKKDYETELSQMEKEDEYKISPYYILYKIIDVMYDKILRSTRLFSSDLSIMEDQIFDNPKLDRYLLEEIMIKRRNVVALKHTVLPQIEIIEELQEETLKFYEGEFDVYFEDLEYKLDKIMSNLNILKEDVESLYDTYNAMVSMKINSIITLLTIFTAVLGVMTLITGFYGMNVTLPGGEFFLSYVYILGGMGILATIMLFIFRRNHWI